MREYITDVEMLGMMLYGMIEYLFRKYFMRDYYSGIWLITRFPKTARCYDNTYFMTKQWFDEAYALRLLGYKIKTK